MASKPPQNHSKPTSANPWDVPPTASIGSPAPADIYHSVGASLSAWEELEGELAKLFATFARSTSLAAMAAYGAAVAHSTRQDMLIAAAGYHLLDRRGDPEKFRKVLSEISRLSGRRNDIAHGLCRYEDRFGMLGYYLMPPFYNTNKWPDQGRRWKFAYTHQKIDAFRASFVAYRGIVNALNHEIED